MAKQDCRSGNRVRGRVNDDQKSINRGDGYRHIQVSPIWSQPHKIACARAVRGKIDRTGDQIRLGIDHGRRRVSCRFPKLCSEFHSHVIDCHLVALMVGATKRDITKAGSDWDRASSATWIEVFLSSRCVY